MSTPVGVIRKFVKALVETKKTGTDAVNEALKAVGVHSEYGDYGEHGNYSAFLEEFEAAKDNYSIRKNAVFASITRTRVQSPAPMRAAKLPRPPRVSFPKPQRL